MEDRAVVEAISEAIAKEAAEEAPPAPKADPPSTATWLYSLLEQFDILQTQFYNPIHEILVSGNDASEKLEKIEEMLDGKIDEEKLELFLRLTLKTLEERTVESLTNPEKFNQTLKLSSAGNVGNREVKKSLGSTSSAVAIAALATAASAQAAAALPTPSTLKFARIDDDLEDLVLDHYKELKNQGSIATESLVDLYEKEVDVYNTLSPVHLLQALFSHMTPNQIDVLLEEHHYNIEDTMESLFAFNDEPTAEELAVTANASYDVYTNPNAPGGKGKSKQVCRHFLLGQCYRSDCWYSHDPEIVLCKFWLKGTCIKGDSCEFSHGQALQQLSFPKAVIQQVSSFPSPPPPSLDDFPSLRGATIPTSPAKSVFSTPISYKNAAISKKKKPSVSAERLNAQMNSLGIADGSSSREIVIPSTPEKKGKAQVLKDIDPGWVTTGDTLGNTYLAYRKEAIEVALNRNRLFQKATEAYLSGNKAAARALSLQAHELNSQVSQLHSVAAANIFKERNSVIKKSKEPVIDLHGLHPGEAEAFLEESIQSLITKEKYQGRIVIVTGTGHHSRGRVKVLPALREYLESKGYSPKDASLSDGKGGMLVIKI